MLKTIPIWPQCSINLTPILLLLFISPVKGWQSSFLSCSDGRRSRGPLSALLLQLVCLYILKTCLTPVFPPHCLTTLTSQTCCYSEIPILRIVSVFQASHTILTIKADAKSYPVFLLQCLLSSHCIPTSCPWPFTPLPEFL